MNSYSSTSVARSVPEAKEGIYAATTDSDNLAGRHGGVRAEEVTADFVFGRLAATLEGAKELAAALRGVQHKFALSSAQPGAGDDVTVRATTGPAMPAQQLWLYYTTDGSRPVGVAGVATSGHALPMVRCETLWSELIWDYLLAWEAIIPAQESGVCVRYSIEAVPRKGSIVAPAFADAPGSEAGSQPPVFAYLVDAPTAPTWARDAVIYQIFLDRFNPGAGREWPSVGADPRLPLGGTLRGVTEKLGYIADLGANTLWLSPIFPAPSFHRYDATNLFTIDPLLGTNEDLAELVEQAHARGIRVLLDLALNHVSDQHPAFRAALADQSSAYHDWFTWHSWPDSYAMFASSRDLPRVDTDQPAAREYMLSVVRFWIEQYGVDGYRLDYTLGPSHDFWAEYYRTVKAARPDSYSVAEATHGAEMLRSYQGRMDGALDFSFLAMIRSLIAFENISLSAFDSFLESSEHYFARDFVSPTFLDNHDMNRFLWLVRGDKRKLQIAAAIQFTLAAPPIIYYGTEVGIRQQGNVPGPAGDAEARGPMLWGDTQDAELLDYYRRLIAIRHSYAAIRQWARTTWHLDDTAQTYAYAQTAPGLDGVLTVVNLSARPQTVMVSPAADMDLPDAPQDILGTATVRKVARSIRVDLPALTAAIVVLTGR